MMLLYAVAHPTPDTQAAASTAGLCVHRSAGLAVLVEARPRAPERTTRELLAFARTLQGLWSRAPVLPVRFGTTADDEVELDELIGHQRDEWAGRLAAVAGHGECIVHVPVPPGPVPAGSSGTAAGSRESGAEYLRRRSRQVSLQDSAAEDVRALLAPYASEFTALPPVRAGEARLSFLVRDDLVDEARSAVLEWSRTRAGVCFTGPWPPFSFCREEPA
jgi:Gas vesicle synthesis protein GvpL/GvpF